MSLLEKNLSYLNERYPELVNIVSSEIDNGDYTVVNTRNNEVNLHIKYDEENLFYLHSKYNAKSEAINWLSTIGDNFKTGQVLVFGIGMGYFLEAVLAHSDAQQIIVYEPDINIFNQMIRSKDIKAMFSDTRIKMVAVGSDRLILKELAHYITTKLLGNISVIAPPIYHRIHANTLTELKTQIYNAVLNEASNQQTHSTFNKQWIQNILFNLPYTITAPSFSSFKDIWKGEKAIIVGSGPSLQEDVHYLTKLKNKCLIICAGSSVQALQHYGIDPDLVITMDGGIANYHVFENIDTSCSPLLFITQTHHQILDIYKNNMIYAILSNDQVSEYVLPTSQVPSFFSTASVTGTALQAAAYMGIEEIILMGQDLSYPNNKFYCPGVNHITEDSRQQSISHADQQVKNVNGGLNLTSKKMMVTLRSIEEIINILILIGVKVINTSKGGAVIEGSEWVAIEDILPEIELKPDTDFNISNKFSDIILPDKMDAYRRTKGKLNNIIRLLDDLDKKLGELTRKLNDLNKSCKLRNTKRVNQFLSETNDLWQRITSTDIFSVFYSFGLSHHINHYIKLVPQIVEANNPMNKAELIVQHLGDLVGEMISFSPELREIMIQAVNRLDSFENNFK
ncbi:6-hydroxymethylpterin diphosphokinase MptE-like protein [Paenibacillus lutimineralis]|uniref:DUF115 domain-containing protein n=1 Tax=Paenibacillus lutimineralis TaxID=2707005 RepID=A0A3Q9IC88_9BACL|nr:6-hydroxymethylpterin diphosphokinase MptE-like protein [Paenibacillus lutimineralis]AZS17585.1 DUF115 domain-containing protein [Paenibacillus lutimineralis]